MALLRSLALGFVGGMRSMSGPAAASWATALSGTERPPVPFLREPIAPLTLGLLAAGEILADKLPFMPDRTAPPSFAARLVSGAVSGACVAGNSDGNVAAALIGIAGAAAGTIFGSRARARLADTFRHDLPAALIEDLLVVAIAATAVLTLPRSPSAQAG